jgi:hypothetical protein
VKRGAATSKFGVGAYKAEGVDVRVENIIALSLMLTRCLEF